MTNGFQQQHHDYAPILRTAGRSQQVGTKLRPLERREPAVPAEPRSFKPAALGD